jgi:hypothetical protein
MHVGRRPSRKPTTQVASLSLLRFFDVPSAYRSIVPLFGTTIKTRNFAKIVKKKLKFYAEGANITRFPDRISADVQLPTQQKKICTKSCSCPKEKQNTDLRYHPFAIFTPPLNEKRT